MTVQISEEAELLNQTWDVLVGVSILSPTGLLLMEGVEEYRPMRAISCNPGWHWFVLGQRLIDDNSIISSVSLRAIVGPVASRIYAGFADYVAGHALLETADLSIT